MRVDLVIRSFPSRSCSIVHEWLGRVCVCVCRRMPLKNDIFINVEIGTTTSNYVYSNNRTMTTDTAPPPNSSTMAWRYPIFENIMQMHMMSRSSRPSQTILSLFRITRSHSYNERTATTKNTGTPHEVHAIIVQQWAVQTSLFGRDCVRWKWEWVSEVNGGRPNERISIFKLLFGCIWNMIMSVTYVQRRYMMAIFRFFFPSHLDIYAIQIYISLLGSYVGECDL